MAIHNCPDCGLVHEVTEQRESPDVAIARIQAESAFKIAQLQARADKHAVDTVAEAELEIAETEAEADVLQAEAIGDAVEAGLAPEEIPVITVDETPVDEVPQEDPLDPPDDPGGPDTSAPRKRSLGAW
jgi:hypothetical protein